MNTDDIRKLFPITKTMVETNNGKKNLIYLDHGASTHAPQPVLDTYLDTQMNYYANVHRGNHFLSCVSTEKIEEVPLIIADFLGIKDPENSGMHSVLTYNTTSSLDLASHVFANIEGEVLTTLLEHHSNDLPHRSRGKVHHGGILDDGTLDMDHMEEILQNNNIKLLAVTGASNVTGFLPEIDKLARMAHDNGAKILVDAAQMIAHYRLEVKPLDHPEHIDFLAAAGHKFYSPFGSAFLIGNTEEFDNAPPYIPGGGTVKLVTKDDAVFVKGSDRHSYGTPNIAGSIAMGRSLQFLKEVGIDYIEKHERELLGFFEKGLRDIEGVDVLGEVPLDRKIGVVSFNIDNMYHEDVSVKLNRESAIATRNGCFCAHPYLAELMSIPLSEMNKIKEKVLAGEEPRMPGAVRATIGLYNTREELQTVLDTVEKIATGKL